MKRSKTLIGICCIAVAIGVGVAQWYLVKTASPNQKPIASASQSSMKVDDAYTLKDGQMFYSVPVKNLADSLSGKLQKGDIVRVAVPPQITGNNNVTVSSDTLDALKYLRVEAVTASNGEDAGSQSASSTATSSVQPATVTLIVNEQQLNAFTSLGSSEISFALVSRGDETKAKALLDEQNALLGGTSK